MPNGTIKLEYQKGSEQAGQTIAVILDQIASGINQSMGQPEPFIKVSSEAVGQPGMSSFDYIFSGLLAFSLMSMGVFGLANQMPTEKEKGSFRRLRAAPFTAGQLILANTIHFVLISLLSIVSMLIVGRLAFNFQMRGDWLLFSGFVFLAAILTVGFGLLVGSWAKNENQSAPLGNLVAFPMMFLSGAFVPAFLFPEWLKAISQFIPLTPVVDGLQLILTGQANLAILLPKIGIIAAWTVVVYVASIKLFRWE